MLYFLKRFIAARRPDNTYLKNFLFGVEDSLVSTVGLLSGVASASASQNSIVMTGFVLIVVEGLSMGIGSFLTEETAEEIAGEVENDGRALGGGLTMFGSYLLSGMIPLLPYMFFSPQSAMLISIIASLIGLFFLGFGTATYYHRPSPLRRAFKMLVLGGLAVAAGGVIGKIFHL